ncbi:G-protein coupled receptor Mth2-like isoform X2 [Bacillus rossius redtenbacheri]|uniref:G-protein coupled receptor Mth2-like isoform X2 n=1 Tax=Bacillus rossius redtenbacheri TaxID=93214 RepID=UPI002FDE8A5A
MWTPGGVALILAASLLPAAPFCAREDSRPVPAVEGPDGPLYPSGTYWRDDSGEGVWRACNCSPRRPCVRKCCPRGLAPKEDDSCEPDPRGDLGDLRVTVFDPRRDRVEPASFTLVYHDPCSYSKYALEPVESPELDMYELWPDGTLHLVSRNETLGVDDYCLEDLPGQGVVPLVCFPPMEDPEPQEASYTLYPVGMVCSLVFLAATLLTYALVPDLRNLHGLCLMSYVSSLFVAYVLLAVAQLSVFVRETKPCLAVAFIIYFSFLASFFWLNVMCFDIWWTFSGFRPLRGSEKEREHKKFVMYSVYAWGSSSLLLLVCLLTDRHPYVRERVLSPQFGKDRCWFTTQSAEAAYFYGPMGLIVLCNIVLFVLTALRIVKLKKETAMLKGEESRRHDVEENKQRFVLYLKLFVVMGVNWGMEVISFAAGGPQYIWYITDIGNTLQGVLIFLIFVWKEKIRRLLAKRLCPRLARGSGRPGSQTRGTLSKSVATPSSSYSITTKTTCNGETSRMAREESDVV